MVVLAPEFKLMVKTLTQVSKKALESQQLVANARSRALKQQPADLVLNERHIAGVAKAAADEHLSPAALSEITNFLLNQQEYKQLLIRYQGEDVDSPERVKLSARRVGLDLPDC